MPEIARKIGKIMAEFRSTTQDFKSTWEREVNFEEEAKAFDVDILEDEHNREREQELNEHAAIENSIGSPAIKEIDKESFDKAVSASDQEHTDSKENSIEEVDVLSDKRTWL